MRRLPCLLKRKFADARGQIAGVAVQDVEADIGPSGVGRVLDLHLEVLVGLASCWSDGG